VRARGWLASGGAASLTLAAVLAVALVGAGVTREAPIGRVAGTVTMRENGRALPNAEIVLRPIVEPAPDIVFAGDKDRPPYRYARTEEDGSFSVFNVAAGKYRLEAYGKAHEMKPIEVEVLEGRTNRFELVLEPRPPSLDLYASQHVFLPHEQVRWDLHGFVEAEEIRIETFRLGLEPVLKEGSLYGTLAPLARRDGKAVDPATLGERIHSGREKVVGRDVEGTFRLNLSLEPLPEGLYWVRCTAGPLSQGTYFSVSRLGLVLKRAGNDALAFAARLDTGKPVPGAEVGYVQNGQFVPAGRTGTDGTARFILPETVSNRNLVALAREGSSVAFVDFYRESGRSEPGRIYLYTDRPVYRPGDTISYKGIVRRLDGSEYRVPQPGPVQVRIRDAQDELIRTETLQTSANGTFSGTFPTLNESAPGSFSIEASFGGLRGYQPVEIAAYRKPNYTVRVRPEKEHYVRGERVRMIVECEYYFGGPVGGAKVQGAIFRAPHWVSYDPDADEDFEDYGGGYAGQWVADVEAVTDSSGKAVVSFDSRLQGEGEASWFDSKLSLVASVADEAGAYFEGRGSTLVSAGEFALLAEPSHYMVESGQSFDVTFRSEDPLSGEAVEGRRLHVVAGYEFWDGLTVNFRPFAERTVITDATGRAAVEVTPAKGGSVVVRATSKDDRGNEVVSETHVHSSSDGESYALAGREDFSIQLDKRRYDPGQRAKVALTASKPGATALLTVEGEGIHLIRTVELKEGSATVDLPVLPSYAPNVYVSACLVQEKSFRSGQRRLNVELGRRQLRVEVEPDKPSYLPGETATYAIRTFTAQGSPTPAEVSLSVVDEAVYAVREDRTDLLAGFYPKRYNSVSTSYSFEELYLDGGDKAPPNMEVRRRFRDTAYWNPTIQTDAQGRASVRVPLPDNLTTWRATVHAVDGTTAVGSAQAKAIARKPLMVRLQTPAFYVSRDEQRLSASVTNATGRSAEVQVEIQFAGATTQDAARQTLRLADGETKAAQWRIHVGETGEAAFTARTWVDERTTDAVEAKVPILPAGPTDWQSFSGEVAEQTNVRIPVHADADPKFGALEISLAPHLAAPLFQSLDDLINFPYGCVEQTMSRFMPAVVVSQVVQKLGLPKPSQAGRLPQIADESFARLANMQTSGGGWGWWEYGEADLYMTAYVLEGIHRAKAAGFPPRRVDLERAVRWAETELSKELPQEPETPDFVWERSLDERTYLAYVLALHGKTKAAKDFLARAPLNRLGTNGLAFVVLTAQTLTPGLSTIRDSALAKMKAKAIPTAGMLRWEERFWGVETTARCLQALVAAEPKTELVAPIVKYLMFARRGSWWSSTRDTALALLALADHLRASGAVFGEANLSLSVNGRPLGYVRFTPQSVVEASRRIAIPMELLRKGENVVEIKRSGPGTAFYSMQLTQAIALSDLPATSTLEGVTVTRTYHRLVQERLENGRLRLVPAREALTSFRPGELVRCVIRVRSNRSLQYVQIEDPIPSNCRVVERENLDYGDDWTGWWWNLSIRDDRVAYFSSYVGNENFEVSYNLRAEQPGVSTARPAAVFEMYEPSLRARSAQSRLEVRP
jgi:alpha-2-macroglobulin